MVLRYNSGNKGGIRLSKLNYSYHRFLNNNRNKGIPNLMLWICIGNALVYFLSQFGTPRCPSTLRPSLTGKSGGSSAIFSRSPGSAI